MYSLTQGYFNTRKCGTIYKKRCVEIENGGGLKVCICDTDNCNGAVMAQISKMSIIAIFVLLMLNQ